MTSFATPSIALLALLVACEPPEPTERPDDTDEPTPAPAAEAAFADADDDELVAAAFAGIGYVPVIAWTSTVPGMIDSVLSNNACPALTVDGAGLETYTAAGCTGPSGQTYEGAFVGENLPNLFSEEEPSDEPMAITFDGWAVDDLTVDGTLWQSEAAPTAGYTTRADLTLGLTDLPATSWAAELACSLDAAGGSTCTSGAPVEVTVAGLGTFTVAGPWTMDAAGLPTGELTLVGEDTLTLDLDGMDAETGCIPAAVDGAAIADVCIGGLVEGPVEPPPPEGSAQYMGGVVAVVGDQLEITMWTLGPVASVEAELVVDGSDPELHPVPYSGLNVFEEDAWTVFLTDGTYVPGATTALDPFTNGDALAVKLRAYDEDGEILTCGFGGTVDYEPEKYFDWSDCPTWW